MRSTSTHRIATIAAGAAISSAAVGLLAPMAFADEGGQKPCQSDPKLSYTCNVGDAPDGQELFPGEQGCYKGAALGAAGGAAAGSAPGAAGGGVAGCVGSYVND